jgi:hypothetical protein
VIWVYTSQNGSTRRGGAEEGTEARERKTFGKTLRQEPRWKKLTPECCGLQRLAVPFLARNWKNLIPRPASAAAFGQCIPIDFPTAPAYSQARGKPQTWLPLREVLGRDILGNSFSVMKRIFVERKPTYQGWNFLVRGNILCPVRSCPPGNVRTNIAWKFDCCGITGHGK